MASALETQQAELRRSQGLRYLVTLEDPDGGAPGAPVAGIYVQALDEADAIAQVRAYVARCRYMAWRK